MFEQQPKNGRRRALVSLLAALFFVWGADAEAAKKTKKADEDSGPQVTFMGFRSGVNGKSIIFVEMTAPIQVEMSKAQAAVIFTLKGSKVVGKTNRYPLITNEFGSPIVSAQLVQEKEGVKLIVKLREEVTPSYRTSDVRGGSVLEVEFQHR